MNIMSLLFSFKGRIRRLHFWLAAIGLGIVSSVVSALTLGPAVGAAAASGDPDAIMAAYSSPGAMIYWAFVVLLMWPSLALDIKRCHDRNRSGWFILLAIVPLVNLWVLVELLFLDGTPGPNRFGPSPKGLGGPAAMEGAPPAI